MLPDEVAHLAVTTQLPDGAVLSLRPIRPDDGPMLAEGFRRLSPESRFLRFFSPLDHLSAAQLRYFTDIDYVDHFAWVATIATPNDPAMGVGVARYIRSKTDPSGITAFHLLVRSDNHAMIAAMEDLRAGRRPNDDASVIRFVLDLPNLAEEMRGTAMWKVFRYVGEGSASIQSSVGQRWLGDPPISS